MDVHFEIRAEQTEDLRILTGVAATWDQPYQVWDFKETVSRGAFEFENRDVHLLVGHDYNKVLGRQGKNMEIFETERGLEFRATLPDTELARETYTLVKDGIMDQMSVRMSVSADEWSGLDTDEPTRTINSASLSEISVLPRGANPNTSAEARQEDKSLLEEVRAKNSNNDKSKKMEENKEMAGPTPGEARQHQAPNLGMSQKERRNLANFSVLRAVQIAAGLRPADGLEAEIHQEALKERRGLGVEVGEARAFHFPSGMLGELQELRFQSVTQDSGNKGGALVDTRLGELIRLFRPNPVLASAGATVLSGLSGDIDYPTQGNILTAAWGTEVSDTSEQDMTFGTKQLRPKRMSAMVGTTKQLIAQSSVDVENLIVSELTNAGDRVLDLAGINGSGTGNEPEGILTNSGVDSVSFGGAVSYGKIVEMESALNLKDARINPKYLTNYKVQAALKTTILDAGSGRFLMEGQLTERQMANGYDVISSNLVPSDLDPDANKSAMIFGNFSDLILANWANFSIMVDPYTQMSTSKVRIYLERFCDVLVRRPESFIKAVDITTA